MNVPNIDAAIDALIAEYRKPENAEKVITCKEMAALLEIVRNAEQQRAEARRSADLAAVGVAIGTAQKASQAGLTSLAQRLKEYVDTKWAHLTGNWVN